MSEDGKTTNNQRPRDAATLIVVDQNEASPKVLMGRRRADQVFMPGKFVFPGGRVDPDDKDVASADELAPGEQQKLLHDMKGHPSSARARAIALAAIREVFEETGIIVGQKSDDAGIPTAAGWQRYFAHGYLPMLSELCFFARAIYAAGPATALRYALLLHSGRQHCPRYR